MIERATLLPTTTNATLERGIRAQAFAQRATRCSICGKSGSSFTGGTMWRGDALSLLASCASCARCVGSHPATPRARHNAARARLRAAEALHREYRAR